MDLAHLTSVKLCSANIEDCRAGLFRSRHITGDFGNVPNDGTFVTDGSCFSNHTPNPRLTESNKVIEPIRSLLVGRVNLYSGRRLRVL
jgi:hypothetical protein